MFKTFFWFSFFIVSFLNAQTINIAVATNVSYAIKPLVEEFNKTNKTKVRIIFGSSGKLTAQIKNKAPFDVFLSANMKYPNALYHDNLTIIKPVLYAQGSLSIFSSKKRVLKNISIINSVKRVAIANPKTAPYGKAAKDAIKNANLFEKNKNKFIYAENISQTVQYTLNATDIGFIAKSSLYSSKMQKYLKKGSFVDVDKSLYKPINQGIALLNKKKEAKEFYDFILSAKAKKIFKKFGYIVE